MKAAYEPLFTQVSVVTPTAYAAGRNRVEQHKYENLSEQTYETLTDLRLPVPLYVIAAAALLG